ncbi:ABC transporter permease subunit [Streptacidiphilus jiangxiensis]|uniref:ABC-2 type transport system permease protein n=1 Tax=Streptacidiphilus jiangxiensis TaxID=235985 RepID=A0A1H7N6R3_STRJI|nr:ABC transporter permease subunit [Streptacidiphilus jiangxiensis]SEL19193.1 ABC-2 type transport system permease protein [Streptacidiphilus jiangxiensis]
MHDLIRTEGLKLHTLRSPWLVLGAAPVLVTAGISGLVLSRTGPLDTAAQSGALAHVGLSSLFTLVFGILVVAGEYRHRTVTDTFLSVPARRRVIGAKLALSAVLAAACGVVSSAVGLAVAAAWWADKGVRFDWSDATMWATIGGGVAWNAAFAAIGVGVGALIRSLVGAVAVSLAWVALVEGIVGQLVGNLARWLPFNAGQALGAGASAMTRTDLLPRWGGGVVLAAYTVLFAVLAVTTTARRDVS